MAAEREDVAEFLADRPDLEDALRSVLDVDQRSPTWTFEDVPIDSGAFGEIVSRGIVEQEGDGYRISDRTAVKAELDGTHNPDTSDSEAGVPSSGLGHSHIHSLNLTRNWSGVDRLLIGALVGALSLVFVFRGYAYPWVFRRDFGYIVLSGNDPYYYRYWVEQLAAGSGGVFDLSVLTSLPDTVAQGEPLMIVTLWWVTELLGGDLQAAGTVLAWYPVVSGVVTGVIVYVLAVKVTEDRRVGVAAVALLAIIPMHGFRTSIGFADHHAFDYPWLALTLLSVVVLASESAGERSLFKIRKRTLAALALGLGVTAQTLAWEASPLLIAPIAVYVVLRSLSDVAVGTSPLRANGYLLAGLGLATVLAGGAHLSLGWHTGQVAYAPALLFIGALGTLTAGTFVRRYDRSFVILAGLVVVGASGAAMLMQVMAPTYWNTLANRVLFVLLPSGVFETQSIFAAPARWFLQFGFAVLLAYPLAWASRLTIHPRWLAMTAYGWYFFFLAFFQMRFTGAFSLFVAVLAGVGFVHLASMVTSVRPPATFRPEEEESSGRVSAEGERGDGSPEGALELPEPRTVAVVVVLFLVVGSVGIVWTPKKIGTALIDDRRLATASAMNEYAEERGWGYPQSYVLSKWGRNRVYNYFVNRQSRSYGFAKANYEPFLASRTSTGDEWYRTHRGRVGFVVTGSIYKGKPDTMQERLHESFGSRGNGVRGVSHFRAIFASEEGTFKAFAVVPGARIIGAGPVNGTRKLSTDVRIEGASFAYERQVSIDSNGRYNVTVPYPGEYTIGNESVAVSEQAVESGTTIWVT